MNKSKGYLILVQNSASGDYIKMAYALALSIKNTQSTVNSVSLIIDNTAISDKIKSVFDHIVYIGQDEARDKTKWKIENKWRYYELSPYDETVILDADMLFTSDISYWWDILGTQDIWITDKPKTFKGEDIVSTKYRTSFITNKLPNVYSAFMYFKKCELAEELFSFIEIIFKNWEDFFYNYLDETRPTHLSGDVAFALAIQLLGIEDRCFGNLDKLPTFVHMKGLLQNIDSDFISEDWTKHIPTYFREDGGFKIGNYEQVFPFHYHIKEWLTDDKIALLEKANKK